MKNKIIGLLMLLSAFSNYAKAQITQPHTIIKQTTPIVRCLVAAVAITMVSSTPVNNTAAIGHFKATISSWGKCNIQYQWATLPVGNGNPGGTSAPHPVPGSLTTLTLSGTGTDVILYDMSIPTNSGHRLVMQILAPNQLSSNTLIY